MMQAKKGAMLSRECSGSKKETSYLQAKNEIQTTWPSWKKDAYNANFATSAHAKKVIV